MFGFRLREVRKSKELTLEELANMYNRSFGGGMNKGTLSRYENGKQEPMIKVVGNLATILGVPVDYLLGKIDDLGKRESRTAEAMDLLLYNEDYLRLIERYSALEEAGRKHLLRYLDLLCSENKEDA